MNRVWAAAGLLAAVAGLCAFCLWYVHLSTDNLTAELETITAALEREDRAVALQEQNQQEKTGSRDTQYCVCFYHTYNSQKSIEAWQHYQPTSHWEKSQTA